MQEQTYKAIIFDLDGTLVDTGALIGESFRYTIHKVFHDGKDLSELTALVGIPLKDQMQFFANKYFDERNADYQSVTDVDELVEELLAIYRAYNALVHDRYIRSFDGVEDFLIQLQQRNTPVGVATSKRHGSAVEDLSHFDLYRYFDVLIGADDVAEHKPKPMPLLKALEGINAKRGISLTYKDCIYIGDSPFDVQAARAAEMLSVGVSYGMFGHEILAREKPDILLETPHDLLSLLRII